MPEMNSSEEQETDLAYIDEADLAAVHGGGVGNHQTHGHATTD
ncbi:hypothetical protein SAMN05428945_0273 [Streptomyces sp. 2224.1]|nr:MULTISPECIES: hypothetical protein [unclassified Streptomyces]PBC85155.1 hypothetical protein BX261_5156 [Streptomyces sp. 2321.6]SDR21106.1 hypothetical protein SAMN05216511_2105 [Streptomyces sp. KS_16]SED57787.1 hypothetical protein SAMN05428940_5182 [Streptomyces sp. 2133.1]SEE26677.1 hypothetical protein SAMN05428954_2182 [Streptomyces sp. 2112.3]SEB53066.1 hypothetical protein SAMN05428945_0273 [Streptomyces sp. 2224.1]